MRLIHSGDTHIGYRQYGLTLRKTDFEESFRNVVETARRTSDVLLLAGDIFEHEKPDPDDLESVREIIKASGVPAIGIEGTHDSSGRRSILSLCGIFDLEKEPFTQGGVTVAGVHGRRDPAELYATIRDVCARFNPDILTIHQGVAELFPFGYDITAASLKEALSPKVELVLMGHIHKACELRIGGTLLSYCGSTEMNDIDEDRDKSVSLITGTSGNFKMERLSIPVRKLEKFKVEVPEDVDALTSMMESIMKSAQKKPFLILDVERSLVKNIGPVVREALKNEIPVRTSVFKKNDDSIDLKLRSIETWDRHNIMPDIDETVLGDFAKDSEECRLVVALTKSPENKEKIIEEFLKRKGSLK